MSVLPGAIGAGESRPAASLTIVWRLRLLAAWLLLAGLAFRQAGGLTVPDTKFDLTANPGAFMARALHLWDPNGAMGQLQNQAYGYLIPVGPIHWALVSVGIPPWIVQRLWWALILIVAFTGLWMLSGALRMGDRWGRYLGSLLFALSPRFLSEIAVTSVEVWPMALAPWVLLPLVARRDWGWPLRLGLSALAVAAVGGVNAVATGATLVLPFLWFLTRRPWKRALPLAFAWLGCVLVAISWWLGPLLVLGKYSPAFLDWIENARITTAFASVFNTLVGTTPWLNFLSGSGGPAWPAGWAMVTKSALVLTVTIVPVLGLAGIASSPHRHRVFLVSGLLVGFALTMFGHMGPLNSVGAGLANSLLDASASPLRNTHKFELVVRIPLALGTVWTLTWLRHVVARQGVMRPLRRLMIACLVLMIAAPAANGLLAKPEGFVAIPSYWREAGRWLDENADTGTTMTVPATSFADFVWGSTKDDPLQALSARPFVTRDAVPLGSAGTTRWLDEVERLMGTGQGGPGLAAGLELAGVQRVLVRNDLRSDVIDAPNGRLARVHSALMSAGLVKVAGFGPPLGPAPSRPAESENVTVDQRSRLPYQLLEIYALPSAEVTPYVAEGDGVVVVAGGAEDVPHVLAQAGPGHVAVVGTDAEALPDDLTAAATTVVTDGNQRREVAFGRAVDNRSGVLSATDGGRGSNATMTYVADPEAEETTRVYTGALAAITASSSASDADASWRFGSAYDPTAVLDGDAGTAWVSGEFASGVGQFLELHFTAPIAAEEIVVSLARNDAVALPRQLEVQTDAGTARASLTRAYGPQQVKLPPGTTQRIRIVVTEVDDSGRRGTALSEVSIPGVTMGTTLRLPAATRAPDVVSLRDNTPSGDCIWVVDRPLCLPGTGRQREGGPTLSREVDIPTTLSGPLHGTAVVATDGGADRLLDDLVPIKVTGSSRASAETGARPGTVVDGSMGTGWIAHGTDERPTLTLTLPQPTAVSGIQFLRDGYLAASKPDKVTVTFDDGSSVAGSVSPEGTLSWPARTTGRLSVEFGRPTALISLETATSLVRTLPVGGSEIVIPGVTVPRPLPLDFPTQLPCGFGPDLVINEATYPTSVRGTIGDLLSGGEMDWSTCGDTVPVLPAGRTTVMARATAEIRPVSATFGEYSESGVTSAAAEHVTRFGSGFDVSVDRSPRSRLLVIPMNSNLGWRAEASGVTLEPVRANGWQQAFILPPNVDGNIQVRFAPELPYQWALGVGVALLIALLTMVTISLRRGARPRPALIEESSGERSVVGLLAVVVSLTLLAGLAGAAIGVISLVICAGLQRPWQRGIVISAAAASAASFVARDPWPGSNPSVYDVKVQMLALLAVGVSVTSAAWDRDALGRALDRARQRSWKRSGTMASTESPSTAGPKQYSEDCLARD